MSRGFTPPRFGFMAWRRQAAAVSLLLVALSITSLSVRGLNLGMDFTGGLLVELGYAAPPDVERVRGLLAEAGLPGAQVQTFGSTSALLVRLPPQPESAVPALVQDQLLAPLQRDDTSVEVRRVEFVGTQVGEDLTEQGGLAMMFALIMIFIYVMLRFRWKLAAGALVALVHDVIITLGFFSVTGLAFDVPVLGSVLAVIGYSLNDTIVVFDRVRDNFRRTPARAALEMMDLSINQTLARTLVTGITTLLVLLALLLVGGKALEGFSVALIVGILVGTYSSIYVAGATALALEVVPADLVAPPRPTGDAVV